MKFTRRDALSFGAATITLAAVPAGSVFAAGDPVDEMIKNFTGGAAPSEGGVVITAPEIAENGNTVPIEVAAEGASSIMIVSTGNPNPGVVTFTFGPAAGAPMAVTRIRLAKTQDVLAVAKRADGSFVMAAAAIKVTIGGCGG